MIFLVLFTIFYNMADDKGSESITNPMMRSRLINYYGQYYRVLIAFIGRRVWTVLKGETLSTEWGKEVICSSRVKTG